MGKASNECLMGDMGDNYNQNWEKRRIIKDVFTQLPTHVPPKCAPIHQMMQPLLFSDDLKITYLSGITVSNSRGPIKVEN